MAAEWTVTGLTGRVVSVSGTLISRGEDSVTVVCAGADAVEAEAGDAVALAAAGWAWTGTVRTSRRRGDGSAKNIIHTCRGHYHRLAEHTFTQPRVFWSDEGEPYIAQSAFVTLFQRAEIVDGAIVGGENLSADDQIEVACEQAGITLAECATGLTLPQCDERGITLKGIIERVVALAPKCAVWFDAAGELHVAPGPDVALDRLLSYDVGARGDLGVKGVAIEVQKTSEIPIDGASRTMLQQVIQRAGASSGPGVCYIPLQAAGARMTSNASPQTAQVEVEAIPEVLSADKAFWIRHVPDLAGVEEEDLTIESAVKDPSDSELPNLALTAIPDAAGRDTADVSFEAVVSYKVRDAGGLVIREEVGAVVKFDGVATDADTGMYLLSASADSETDLGEMLPDGVAASLYAAWSEVFGEGTVTFRIELLSSVSLGSRVTAAGVTGYVQSISFDSSANICRATLSPPDQSGLQSMARLQAGMKYWSSGATSMLVRQEGDPKAGAGGGVDLTMRVPRQNSGSTPGVATREVQHDGSSSPTSTVVRDMADISDEGVQMQYRKLRLPVMADDGGASAGEVWVLAGEHTPDGEITEEDVTLYCKEFALQAKLRVCTIGEGEEAVEKLIGIRPTAKVPYTSAQKRLLLQITEPETDAFVLALDRGYLKQ